MQAHSILVYSLCKPTAPNIFILKAHITAHILIVQAHSTVIIFIVHAHSTVDILIVQSHDTVDLLIVQTHITVHIGVMCKPPAMSYTLCVYPYINQTHSTFLWFTSKCFSIKPSDKSNILFNPCWILQLGYTAKAYISSHHSTKRKLTQLSYWLIWYFRLPSYVVSSSSPSIHSMLVIA